MNLRIFCERLKRVLVGEEGTLTLPDTTKLTPLGNYQGDMVWLLYQLGNKEDTDRPDILGIQKDINYFVHES